MNHKRRKPKNARAGCLLCKPHKANHAPKGGETDKQAALMKDHKKRMREHV